MPTPSEKETRQAICALLEKRGADATICPSEAARSLAGPNGDWRAVMDEIHDAVDHLNAQGAITLSWKGKRLDQRRGAYRIARRRPSRLNESEARS